MALKSTETGSPIKFRAAVIADAHSLRDRIHPFVESGICPRAIIKFHPVGLHARADDHGRTQFKVLISCLRSLRAYYPSQLGAKRIFEFFALHRFGSKQLFA